MARYEIITTSKNGNIDAETSDVWTEAVYRADSIAEDTAVDFVEIKDSGTHLVKYVVDGVWK